MRTNTKHYVIKYLNLTSRFEKKWLSPPFDSLRMSEYKYVLQNLRAMGYQALSSKTDRLPYGYLKATKKLHFSWHRDSHENQKSKINKYDKSDIVITAHVLTSWNIKSWKSIKIIKYTIGTSAHALNDFHNITSWKIPN